MYPFFLHQHIAGNPQIIARRSHKGRAFPSILRASLTLEAALALPLFILVSSAILCFLSLVSLQTDIQLRMEETARSIDRRAYAAEGSDALTTLNANPLTIKAEMLDGSLALRLDRSCIPGGSGGLHTWRSSYDDETGILDIITTYTYRFPYLPASFASLSFLQRSYSRAWIGREIAESEGGGDENESDLVYITPRGSAYHRSLSCPYLDLSIRAVMYSEVASLRNKNGNCYYRCEECVRGSTFSMVYITDYGTSWHTSLSCGGLKRTVMTVDISQVGGRHPCGKCGGGQ